MDRELEAERRQLSRSWMARAVTAERRAEAAERRVEVIAETYSKDLDKLARMREAVQAADELLRWIEREWPKVLVEAPTPIMQRLRRAAILDGEEWVEGVCSACGVYVLTGESHDCAILDGEDE